jgi:hypothetical protein
MSNKYCKVVVVTRYRMINISLLSVCVAQDETKENRVGKPNQNCTVHNSHVKWSILMPSIPLQGALTV